MEVLLTVLRTTWEDPVLAATLAQVHPCLADLVKVLYGPRRCAPLTLHYLRHDLCPMCWERVGYARTKTFLGVRMHVECLYSNTVFEHQLRRHGVPPGWEGKISQQEGQYWVTPHPLITLGNSVAEVARLPGRKRRREEHEEEQLRIREERERQRVRRLSAKELRLKTLGKRLIAEFSNGRGHFPKAKSILYARRPMAKYYWKVMMGNYGEPADEFNRTEDQVVDMYSILFDAESDLGGFHSFAHHLARCPQAGPDHYRNFNNGECS